MPIIIAAVITAAAGAGAGIYAANKSSDTAKQAADTQTAAANHAADDQKASADAALAFQRQQAEADFQNAEATRRANYEQYLNRYHAAQSLGSTIGFNLPDAAGYTPQNDPNYGNGQTPLPSSATTPNSGTTPPGGAGGGAAGSGNPNDPAFIQSQLSNLYRSLGAQPTGRGTGPTDIAYYADQIAKSGGWQGNNIGYWQGRIASDLKGGGASGGGAAAGMGGQSAAGFQAPSASQLFGVNLSPYQQAQGTGQVTPPGYTPFQPTLGSAFGGR